MSEVYFWILLGNELVFVPARSNALLVSFFKDLCKVDGVADLIPAKASYLTCKFYQLNSPVLVFEDGGEDEQQNDVEDFPDSVRQACVEESNRKVVNPGRLKVRQLAKNFSEDCVYLVIDFPDPLAESNRAIRRLMQADHVELFECLKLTAGTLGSWSPSDVERNLQGGILTNNINDLPPEFKEIQETLGRKRVYQANGEQERDFQNARSYRTQFDRVFAPADDGSHTVTSGREFASFYNALRCYHSDVSMIASESSSALKASNFTVHFVQPPFFAESDSSRGFKYYQEKSWSFPVFVGATSAENVWRKFTPRSDWMVITPGHKIPFVISEVISQKKEQDRSRMLVEAIALARTGNFLLKSTSKRTFFIVAIYVAADMIASRYIVMQTSRGNANYTNNLHRDKVVCIHRKDFNLTESRQEVEFLCEMYNLATEITALSGDLDKIKENSLTDIKAVASKVLSLSSPNPPSRTSYSTTMDTIAEGPDNPQDEDELGVFEGEDIQDVLRQMNYKIEFIPWGHPHLAVIVNKSGDKHGYLKFVERDREIGILQYLTEIESPSNHTISGVRFWPVEGGTVISMPVAGGWLTSLHKPGEQLWSTALQFLEAVGFMHGENVAHMDLKPQNVIIPAEGGRLSIIDFSVSIRVRGPDVKYTGIIGTEGYMAPEVRKGQYKPMLADLWSCGKTLEELCLLCSPSADRMTLLQIARELMVRDPGARPKMSTVLEWMATTHRGQDNVVSPVSGLFPVVSPLSA